MSTRLQLALFCLVLCVSPSSTFPHRTCGHFMEKMIKNLCRTKGGMCSRTIGGRTIDAADECCPRSCSMAEMREFCCHSGRPQPLLPMMESEEEAIAEAVAQMPAKVLFSPKDVYYV